MWTYIAGGKRLPVQWTAWLSHTRPHAPTYEELLADIERRRRLLQNVAMIEARDREAKEAARLESLVDSTTQSLLPTDPQASPQLANPQPRHADISPHQPAKSAGSSPSTQPPKPDPWEAARSKASSDEPQAWSPRAVRRGA
ncbi:hypothetical protein QCA50_020243 [Cerrena zonata]|uniref:NADH dehydrogenase [ubiquinone] 1 alpha subcomplex subunit 12 n=1 Tax=Cerrena zonata TaxID=2478898 RepID=A0AAW0FCY4_9APHY